MDAWGFEQLRPWLIERERLPVGPLLCVIDGPTRGRPWSAAGAKRGTKGGFWAASAAMRTAERELARRGELADRRTVVDWQPTQAEGKGAGGTPGRASQGPSRGQATRQVQAPGPAL